MLVEIKNFQSIVEETMEISGFSVVVGRSNIGKSALVRAIKAALTGAPADNYIRHAPDCARALKGAKSCKCFCSVRLVAPGFDLLWEKGDAVNRYLFNGVEHSVVGRGTPEFLGEGLAPIHIGGDSSATLLQVADQFRPLFILDRSGTAVADVLSDVAKLDQINDAVRAAERDRRECAAARKVRDKDLKELDRVLSEYSGLDQAVARVRELEAWDEALAGLEGEKKRLERFVGQTEQLTSAIEALAPVAAVVVPEVAGLVGRVGQQRDLARWERDLRAVVVARRQLEPVAEVEIPDVAGVQARGAVLERISRWAAQLTVMKGHFARLKDANAVSLPDSTGMARLAEQREQFSGWVARLSSVEASALQHRTELAKADTELEAVLHEFRALEVCPTCQQPIAGLQHLHLGAA